MNEFDFDLISFNLKQTRKPQSYASLKVRQSDPVAGLYRATRATGAAKEEGFEFSLTPGQAGI